MPYRLPPLTRVVSVIPPLGLRSADGQVGQGDALAAPEMRFLASTKAGTLALDAVLYPPMNLRRLYVLLAVWVVLLTGPATLVHLAVFRHLDVEKNIGGGLLLAWIVGWLAQFGVFMWIMNIFQDQTVIWRTILWWFGASLLPWGLDWTPPSPYLLLEYGAAIGFGFWIGSAARRNEAFKQHSIRATGTVLEVLKPMMNVVINNVYIKRKVRLRVEREDGAPAYEAVLDGLYMLGEIPSPGDRIPLLVDRGQPQHVEYDESPGATGNTDVRAASAPAPSHGTDIADELERLVRLRDRGALSESEFRAAKKKLLAP
jgi:hypothetical protein